MCIRDSTNTPKKSYYTISVLSAIFSGDIKPADYYVSADPYSDSAIERLCPFCQTFEKNNMPVYSYFVPSGVAEDGGGLRGRVSVCRALPHPVLIDTYSTDVYEIEDISCSNGITYYDNLPMADYPMVIADKSSFVLAEI